MNYSTAQLVLILSTDVKGFFINNFFPFLALLSSIVFLWGVVMAMTTKHTNELDNGKKIMIYGIVGVMLFTILWGIFFFALVPDFVPSNPSILQNKTD
jgi:hypothetical protein